LAAIRFAEFSRYSSVYLSGEPASTTLETFRCGLSDYGITTQKEPAVHNNREMAEQYVGRSRKRERERKKERERNRR